MVNEAGKSRLKGPHKNMHCVLVISSPRPNIPKYFPDQLMNPFIHWNLEAVKFGPSTHSDLMEQHTKES